MRYTKEMLAPIVASSYSVAEVMRKLGLRCSGGAHHRGVRDAIIKFGIDRSHFKLHNAVPFTSGKKHWSEYLVDNINLKSDKLRAVMLESGIQYKCAECGIEPTWRNKPLILQIEHKNGDHLDCRPDNVEFQCPNCHSQTPTHSKRKTSDAIRCKCGKRTRFGRCSECYNRNRASRIPSLEILRELVWQMPSTKIAEKFGVSDKAVTKWCRKYEIAKPGQGYWKKIATVV